MSAYPQDPDDGPHPTDPPAEPEPLVSATRFFFPRTPWPRGLEVLPGQLN